MLPAFALRHRHGFSLIEMTIVLAVLSVILAGLVPYLVESTKTDDINETLERMERIEIAMAAHFRAHGGLPCPSDITASLTLSAFGTKATAAGNSCGLSTTPGDANRESATVARGGVPTKSLMLSDEYAFDGWGRRIGYMVTLASIDSALPSTGAVTINDGTGTARTSEALFALVSHGPNGHGGFTIGGTRYNAGNTNSDEHENCDCDTNPSTVAGTFGTLVQSMKTGQGSSEFDDVVRYMGKDLFELSAGVGAPAGSGSSGCTLSPVLTCVLKQ